MMLKSIYCVSVKKNTDEKASRVVMNLQRISAWIYSSELQLIDLIVLVQPHRSCCSWLQQAATVKKKENPSNTLCTTCPAPNGTQAH